MDHNSRQVIPVSEEEGIALSYLVNLNHKISDMVFEKPLILTLLLCYVYNLVCLLVCFYN